MVFWLAIDSDNNGEEEQEKGRRGANERILKVVGYVEHKERFPMMGLRGIGRKIENRGRVPVARGLERQVRREKRRNGDCIHAVAANEESDTSVRVTKVALSDVIAR